MGLDEQGQIKLIISDQTFASCAEVIEAVGEGKAVLKPGL